MLKYLLLILILAILISIVPFVYLSKLAWNTQSLDDISKVATALNGFVASFFATLSFIAVVITIYLQRKDSAKSSALLLKQQEQLDRQQFENTFFKFVDLHHTIVNSLVYGQAQGRLALLNMHTSIFHSMNVGRLPSMSGIQFQSKSILELTKFTLRFLEDKSRTPDHIEQTNYVVLAKNLINTIDSFATYFEWTQTMLNMVNNLIRMILLVETRKDSEDADKYLLIVKSQLSYVERDLVLFATAFARVHGKVYGQSSDIVVKVFQDPKEAKLDLQQLDQFLIELKEVEDLYKARLQNMTVA